MKKSLYKDYLQGLTKKELEKLVKSYSLLVKIKTDIFKNAKKEEIIDISMTSLQEFIPLLIGNLNRSNYDILNNLLNMKRIYDDNLDIDELAVMGILNKYAFLRKTDQVKKTYYHFYPEIKRLFNKSVKDKKVKKSIKQNDTKYTLSKGIIHAYGALTFDNYYLLLKTEYPSIDKKELLDSIKVYTAINGTFKLSEKKDNIILYSRSFKSITEAQKFVQNDIYAYTYEDYISWGLKNYKYNKEYKKLIKLIRKKYVYSKKDFVRFKCGIFSEFINLYRINKTNAKAFIKKNVKEKFEFKSEKLEDKLLNQMYLVAEEEPCWRVQV